MASLAKMNHAAKAREIVGRRARHPRRQRHPAREPRRPPPRRHGGDLHLRGHRLDPVADRRPRDHGLAGDRSGVSTVRSGRSSSPKESARPTAATGTIARKTSCSACSRPDGARAASSAPRPATAMLPPSERNRFSARSRSRGGSRRRGSASRSRTSGTSSPCRCRSPRGTATRRAARSPRPACVSSQVPTSTSALPSSGNAL